MSRINILYWLIMPSLLVFCYYVLKGYNSKIEDFLGYTENKETEINLDYSAVVDKINVIQGQRVAKGTVLMELSKKSFDKEIENLNQSIAILNNKTKINTAEILTSIEKVKTEKTQRIVQLNNEIAIEESKLKYNKSLLGENVKQSENNNIVHPIQQKIQALHKEILDTEISTNRLIDSYQALLKKMQSTDVEAKTYINNKEYLIEEKNKLKIIAPFDGLIGNINVKSSEFVQAYASLLSFYEPSPINVVGFVHESLSSSISIGDSVIVQSLLHKGSPIIGVVSAKGHRIIEIPERLRKIPEYKIYGTEIYIKISGNNNFLQKEVVKLSAFKND